MAKRRALAIIASLGVFLVAIPVLTLGIPGVMAYGQRMDATAVATSAPTGEKSIFQMTQAERRAAYLAKQEPAAATDRVRWACSARLKDSAYVPGSIEWTRRSQWPVVAVAPGVYEVQAQFTASNRLGVELAVAKRCRVTVTDTEARVVKVS